MRAGRGRPGRVARWIGGWPARRVGLAAVAGGLLVLAAVIGYAGPLLAQDGVGIRFSDLTSHPTHTTVHRFEVQLSNLDAATTYEVVVASDHATALGIGSCGAASQTRTVTGVEAQDLTFVVYACTVGAGTLTATVREAGADTAAATVSQALTVLAIPEGAPAGIRGAPAASAATRGATRAGTPGVVPNVRFDTITTHSARATWGQPSNGGRALTGFGLLFWRKGTPQPPYSTAFVVGAASRSHTYTGLRAGATYRFRIHACNGADSCGWWTHPPKEVDIPPAATPTPTPTPTPTATPTAAPPVRPPVGPPGRPHTISIPAPAATSAEVRWSAAATTGGAPLTGFGILWWPNGSSEPPHRQAAVVGAAVRAYTMTGLTAATTYRVKLRACNGPNRCSAWSADQLFTTLPASAPAPPTAAPPADAPGAVRNLTHTGSGSQTVSIDWDAPTSRGRAALTGYHVQHRVQGTAWPAGAAVVEGANTTAWTIRGLINGTRYEVQVRACNAAPLCGAWTALGRPVLAGSKVGSASLIPSAATIRIGQRQKFEIHDIPVGKTAYTQMSGSIQPAGRCPDRGSAARAPRAPRPSTGPGYYDAVWIEGCADGGTGWLRVVNADDTELYARATITVQAGGSPAPEPVEPPSPGPGQLPMLSGCPKTSSTPAPFGAPQNLDVTPQIERLAVLCWRPVAGATTYLVDVTGDVATVLTTSNWHTRGIVSEAKHAIDLDRIHGNEGFANRKAFGLRVRASDGSRTSLPSPPIIIIDTPITFANGHTTASHLAPEALVGWTSVEGILDNSSFAKGSHYLRFWSDRRPGGNSVADTFYEPTEPGWANSTFIDWSSVSISLNPFKHPGSLTVGRIYPLQLVYKSDSDIDTNDVDVFAARFSYVTPSYEPILSADSSESLWFAGFPMHAPMLTRTYEFRICDDTFPVDRRSDWVKLIKHAIGQWVISTNYTLIASHHNTSDCTDYSNIVNQVVSVVTSYIGSYEDLSDEVRGLVERIQWTQIRPKQVEDSRLNEIIMLDDIDVPGTTSAAKRRVINVFSEFASQIGYAACWKGTTIACVARSEVVGLDGYSSDLFLRRSQVDHDPLGLPGGNEHVDRSDIQFNQCPDIRPYSVYGVLVHEVGHVLGLRSGGRSQGHPSFASTVMTAAITDKACSPHPLDVLATYALYQSR